MTSRLAPLAVCLAACGTAPLPSEPQTLVFEPVSVPQYTSRDVFIGGAGDVVVMSSRISRDGGQTWRTLDARLGQLTRVAVTGSTVTTYASGVVRWDLASDAIVPVAGAPAFASDRTWRVAPGGALRVFDPIGNTIHHGVALDDAPGLIRERRACTRSSRRCSRTRGPCRRRER